ncbi:MAG TPA: L,D-transpeptidase family protein [Rhizomicrobium sp.]|jgi:hypothetical protein
MRQRNKYRYCIGSATIRFIAACACLLAIAAAPAFVSRACASSVSEADASELEPGEFLWDPSRAPDGPMTVIVNLRNQRAYVYRDGVRIGISTISSGKRGHETPTGTFAVLEKQRFHRSNKYDDAPMPYMQRLTWGGLALHGGHVRAHPASHGCVRLPPDFAAALFRESTLGMKVIITDQEPGDEDTLLSSGENARTESPCCEGDRSP